MSREDIQVSGFSQRAIAYIRAYMEPVWRNGSKDPNSIPLIFLVKRSEYYDDRKNIIGEKGERFVLGRTDAAQVREDIIVDCYDFSIAVRIPKMDKFYGIYYFDIAEKIIHYVKTIFN